MGMGKGYINTDNDETIDDGTFLIGDDDSDNIQTILECDQGQIKQYPLIGANIYRYVNGIIDQEAKRKIDKHLQQDGYSISKVNIITQ